MSATMVSWQKKVLDFRWSKKAKMTSETISFWQNIYISILKFSPFLYSMKPFNEIFFNFSKFTNALIKKEKKYSCNSQWEMKNWENLYFVITDCSVKPFKMIINQIFYFGSSFAAQFLLYEIRMMQEISKLEIGNGN